jgi:hypothetical protein
MINIMGKKNLFLTLIAALLLFHFPAVAQKKPFTGKVTYKIDLNMAGLPEEVKGMMPKSMAMYIKSISELAVLFAVGVYEQKEKQLEY